MSYLSRVEELEAQLKEKNYCGMLKVNSKQIVYKYNSMVFNTNQIKSIFSKRNRNLLTQH